MEITENFGPVINNTVSNYTAHGNRTTTYNLPADLFYDKENEIISYSYSTSPSASFVTYDSITKELSIVAGTNDAGIYEFSLTATDPHPDTQSAQVKLNITVINNEAPATTQTFNNYTMLAFHPFELEIVNSSFSDANNDPISINASSNASWIMFNSSNLTLHGTPDNSQIGMYEAYIVAYDDYGGINNITFTINITENNEPVRNNVSISDPVIIQCMHPFQFNFNDYFYDPNNETLVIEDSNSDLLTWTTIDNSTGILSGFHQNQ